MNILLNKNMNKNLQQMRLILHFNIDKTIVMRNSLDLETNNTDYTVSI